MKEETELERSSNMNHDLAASRLRRVNASRPAVSLPSELLVDIFERACDIESRHVSGKALLKAGRLDRGVRRSLSRTCHRWRDVCYWEPPSLWSSFYIRPDDWSKPYPPLPLLELELKRASQRPLTIQLIIDGGGDGWRKTQEVVRTHSSLWEVVTALWFRCTDGSSDGYPPRHRTRRAERRLCASRTTLPPVHSYSPIYLRRSQPTSRGEACLSWT